MGLVNRTTGLLRLIVGLSYFATDKYGEALTIFDRLERDNLLTAGAGAEILYLFQGNAAARLRDFDRADAEYRHALDVRPDYARALIGRAETTYQRSHGGCEEDLIDVEGVRRARDMYLSAGQSRDKPAGANIDSKVALGAGRANLCLSMTRNDDAWADARSELDTVISAYEAGTAGIADLAAEAWSSRGLLEISSANGDEDAFRRAVRDLTRAIDVGTRPGRTYVWHGLLGFAHCRLGDSEAAMASYEEAIAQSPDDESRREYAEARARASASDPAAC
jgi:tetratricopeptide (TPR) repeat protein